MFESTSDLASQPFLALSHCTCLQGEEPPGAEPETLCPGHTKKQETGDREALVCALGLHMHPTSIYEGHGLLKDKYVVPDFSAWSLEVFHPTNAKGIWTCFFCGFRH
eukprot:s3958_g4.t1